MRHALPLALLLLGLSSAAPAHAARYAYIDGENASIRPLDDRLVDGGREFILDTESNGRQAWLSSSTRYRGSKGIGFQLRPDTDGRKERSEVVVNKDDDAGALRVGQTRYLGFALYPHVDTARNMSRPVIIAQVAQRGHRQASVNVLLYFQRTDGVPRIWLQTYDPTSPDFVWRSQTFDIPHQRWSRIKLGFTMQPRATGSNPGRVKLWINGRRRVNEARETSVPLGPGVENRFKIACGLYAPRPSGQQVVVMMDNIRYGTTSGSANP